MPNLTLFLYIALAAWRLANLITNENGPFKVFAEIREYAHFLCEHVEICARFGLDELITCEYCISIWIGVALTLLYLWIGDAIVYLALPFAISAVVIIVKYVHQYLRAIAP